MDSNKDAALAVVNKLKDHGYQAYFAGGCVRDMVLNRTPQDYDVATDALPEEIERLFRKTVLVGKQFGVVKVVLGDNIIEVTTFRNEGEYKDGRRPSSVTFSKTPEEDVKRRDFTVNGLMYDTTNGSILDFVGGVSDIKNKIIRTIGNPEERFIEDGLRLIRAVRFSAKLRFQIDGNTFDAIKKLAGHIRKVSMERIQDEFRKILIDQNRVEGIKLLDATGLLKEILPELEEMKGVEQPPEYHPEGDVWTHTLLTLEKLDSFEFDVSLGALLHDVGKPRALVVRAGKMTYYRHEYIGEKMAEDICKRFRVSNKETEVIKYIVKNHLKFKDVLNMRISTLKRFLQEEHFEKLRKVAEADTLASTKDSKFFDFIDEFIKKSTEEELRPDPLVRGKDLLRLGLKAGPQFSKILRDVYDKQLENAIKSKEEAISYIKREYISKQ